MQLVADTLKKFKLEYGEFVKQVKCEGSCDIGDIKDIFGGGRQNDNGWGIESGRLQGKKSRGWIMSSARKNLIQNIEPNLQNS